MDRTDFKPLSYAEFEATIKAINVGEKHVPAFEGYIDHLTENIKFHPGDIVRIETMSPEIHDDLGLQGVGIVVEVPRDLSECYTEYRDAFRNHVKSGRSVESFYEDPYGCNYDEWTDYCVQIGQITEENDVPYAFVTSDRLCKATNDVSDEDKATLLSWYAQHNKKVEEAKNEEARIIAAMTDYVSSKAKYGLFREYTGKWGTRDANGDIHDKAIYDVVERDGKVVFTDGRGCVCEFDPDEGMTIAAWCQPWWENTLLLADFPEDLNKYWWARRNESLDMFDEIANYEASKLSHLTDLQRRILKDLEFVCQYEQSVDDGPEKLEQEWFAIHSNELSNNERVAALADLIRRPDVSDDMKASVWYANFMFIEYFGQ